jgi:hypothetical protein
MPEKETIRRAKEDAREGKSASTQAGEFVREEIHHIRKGKHGASSSKQAVAIGLSKARRAGVKLKPPKSGSSNTRRKAAQDSQRAEKRQKPSRTRSRATTAALKRKGKASASRTALARQAHSSAKRRGKKARVSAAKKAARTRKSRS